MMDDIDLQLCLSIDPLPSPRNTCEEERQISPRPRDQSQALIHLCSKERPVSVDSFQEVPGSVEESGRCVARDADGMTSQTPTDSRRGGSGRGIGLDGHNAGGETNEEHNGDYRSIHEFSPGHYLRLPPRKRVRTSFVSLPSRRLSFTDQSRVHDNIISDKVFVARGQSMDRVDSLAASLPEVELEGQYQEVNPGDNRDRPTELLPTDGPIEMDVDDDDHNDVGDGNDTDASEASTVLMPPPSSNARPLNTKTNNTFRRLEPPPPPPYPDLIDPSLLVYGEPTWSKQGEKDDSQTGQQRRFSIYEDPDGMDIDGVGFFETGWYISPEDDKENFEEEENHGQNTDNQSQLQGSHDYEPEPEHRGVYGHDLGHENVSQPPSHGAEQDAYHPTVAMGQRAYYAATNTAPARSYSLSPSGTRLAGSRWATWSAQIPAYFQSTEPGSIESSILSRNSDTAMVPTPAPTPSRPDLHTEHDNALPSPTSLSATDLSLRVLSNQSTSPSSVSISTSTIHTPNDLEENPRSRRLRRVIRSVNFT
ncbi:hypothetical protein BDV19DRAFT_387337 [Aspergillus venezuelensis]